MTEFLGRAKSVRRSDKGGLELLVSDADCRKERRITDGMPNISEDWDTDHNATAILTTTI